MGRQIWCTWSRAAHSITAPLPSPQCWRGQDGCVYRSGPPHSAHPWSWFCGYLRSGGRTAQRADVYGAESGEFASSPMIYEPERPNKRRKKWFRTVFHHKSHSTVVLLFTLYSALLWSLPHEGILILTKGDRRWNKSTFWAGFPYLEMTGILHLLDSVIGFRKDPLPRAQGFFFPPSIISSCWYIRACSVQEQVFEAAVFGVSDRQLRARLRHLDTETKQSSYVFK